MWMSSKGRHFWMISSPTQSLVAWCCKMGPLERGEPRMPNRLWWPGRPCTAVGRGHVSEPVGATESVWQVGSSSMSYNLDTYLF